MPKRPMDGDVAKDPEAKPADTDAAPAAEESGAEVQSAPLQPIGSVRRELVRPDGTKVYVDVPVYPPFRLDGDGPPRPKQPPRRLRPSAKKPRPTGSD